MGLTTIFVSILISIVSAYCTVTGIGKIFAGASIIAMGIATVIEIGRVTLVYNLHHYWEKLDFIKKLTGIGMLLIACSISAMGIFGFLSNAHLENSMEITPIIQEINGKENQIKIIEQNIKNYKTNIDELKNIYGGTDSGIDTLLKKGYVTKAFNFKKEQQEQYDELFKKINDEQNKISSINNEIVLLKQKADSIVPELGALKYVVRLFNVQDEDMAMIIFICMIMCVFDTLAIYLMIMGDWIGKLSNVSVKEEKPILETPKISYDLFPVQQMKYDVNIDTTLSDTLEKNNKPKKHKKHKKENKNNDLEETNNIDSSYKNIVKLIQSSNKILDEKTFKEFLDSHPEVMARLKQFLKTDDDEKIYKSVNNIIKK